jgi:hypothetical protein
MENTHTNRCYYALDRLRMIERVYSQFDIDYLVKNIESPLLKGIKLNFGLDEQLARIKDDQYEVNKK